MSNTSVSILILGGGTMQLPAIRIARQRGWSVIIADGNAECEGRDLADHFLHIDLKDPGAIAKAARLLKPPPDGVFTAGTDFSASVAEVAFSLRLPGLAPHVALDASDKSRMRERFRAAGVPSPQFVALSESEISALQSLTANLSGTLVVKPVDNMGARGVVRIERRNLLGTAVNEAIALSRSRRAIIEEFIDGPEYSIDAIVSDGEVTICGVADRHIFFPPHFVEMGHTIPSAANPEVTRELESVFRSGVRALGITNGAAKGDVFYGRIGNGPIQAFIGEIAARLSGGYMSGWTFPFASGVEPTAAALNIAVGLPPGDLSPSRSWTSAERAFISVPGRVRTVEGEATARAVPGVRELFLRVKAGDIVRVPRNNVEKCGNVIATLPRREDAIRAAQQAAAAMQIVLEPNDPATDEFLFSVGTSGTESPEPAIAFTLSVRDNEMHFEQFAHAAADAVGTALAAGRPVAALFAYRDIGRPLRVPELPRWQEESIPSWSGTNLAESVQKCIQTCNVELANRDSGHGLEGFLFWSAILRGGEQGVRYLCDSVAAPPIA